MYPPNDLVLLLNLDAGSKRYCVGRMNAGLAGHARSVKLVRIEAEIAWPPTHLVLTDDSNRRLWPRGMDILAWLRDPPTVQRDVALQLSRVGDGDLFMDQFVVP